MSSAFSARGRVPAYLDLLVGDLFRHQVTGTLGHQVRSGPNHVGQGTLSLVVGGGDLVSVGPAVGQTGVGVGRVRRGGERAQATGQGVGPVDGVGDGTALGVGLGVQEPGEGRTAGKLGCREAGRRNKEKVGR